MIQRTAVIKELNYEYQKPGSQLVVFYGRQGLDKELYIRSFLKGKEFFYYRAREISEAEQKKRFVEKIEKQYHLDAEEIEYDLYFEKMKSSDRSKFVIVFDEFEHLARKNSDFLEVFFKLKQNIYSDHEYMILLCSSSLVFTEHKMPSVLGKLFYEIDSIHKIAEMNFVDLVRSFPENSISECVQIFGVLGGIPSYLKHWNPKKSVRENICRIILSPNGSLFLEAERYLRTQLRELSVYNTILMAMAAGNQKLNDLHTYTGYSRAKISVYLKNLMEFEVIDKAASFETGGRENVQKGMYQIKNTFLHFWFKFVFPNLSDLYQYTPEEFYDMHIEGEFEGYLNHYFAKVCMEYMKLMNRAKKLPFQFDKIGTWIGKRGMIDIIAQNSVRENIVGICNWSEKTMTYARYGQLEELLKQAHIKAEHYFLFSATSFDFALINLAKQENKLTLVDITEL